MGEYDGQVRIHWQQHEYPAQSLPGRLHSALRARNPGGMRPGLHQLIAKGYC